MYRCFVSCRSPESKEPPKVIWKSWLSQVFRKRSPALHLLCKERASAHRHSVDRGSTSLEINVVCVIAWEVAKGDNSLVSSFSTPHLKIIKNPQRSSKCSATQPKSKDLTKTVQRHYISFDAARKQRISYPCQKLVILWFQQWIFAGLEIHSQHLSMGHMWHRT